jgi:hypothetical protein
MERILTLSESFEEYRSRECTLSPNLVPHEQFHLYEWIELGSWWWTHPAESPAMRMAELHTVDEKLRPLVSLLNERGIKTGPSCAGHRDFNLRRMDVLQSIQKTSSGSVPFEIGDRICVRLEPLSDDWYDSVCAYQRRGVLSWETVGWESFTQWPGILTEDGGITILVTENYEDWTEVESIWRARLSEESPGYPGQSASLATQLYTQVAAPTIGLGI